MKNIYSKLIRESENNKPVALATLLDTRGSVPQVRGATALFSEVGLIAGTLGGGVLEADASQRVPEILRHCSSDIYEFDLNAEISSKEAAICGGSAIVLINACLEDSRKVFLAMEESIQSCHPGVLLTSINRKEGLVIERQWFESATGEMPNVKIRINAGVTNKYPVSDSRNCRNLRGVNNFRIHSLNSARQLINTFSW